MAKQEIATSEAPSWLVNTPTEIAPDNFGAEDIAIPQIRLLQGLSEAVTQFDHAKIGEYWHTGLDKSLGNEFRFIVCSRRRKYLLLSPLEDGQGVLARADDGVNWNTTGSWDVQVDKKTRVNWNISDLNVVKSGLAEYGTYDSSDKDSPPAATLFYEYLVLIPEHLDYGPAVISLARSQLKKAKRGLNDKIALHQSNRRPMAALIFAAKSVEESNASNQSYWNWSFTGAGFVNDQKLYQHACSVRDELSLYRVADEANVGEKVHNKGNSGEF